MNNKRQFDRGGSNSSLCDSQRECTHELKLFSYDVEALKSHEGAEESWGQIRYKQDVSEYKRSIIAGHK